MLAVSHPNGILSNWVECIWLYDAKGESRGQESALPTGTVEVVFNLGDQGMLLAEAGQKKASRFLQSVVCGPHSRPFTLLNRPDDHVLGLHLKPVGAAKFLSVSSQELTNRHLELDSVCPRRFRDFHERVAAASPGRRLDLAGRLLTEMMTVSCLPDPEIGFVVEALRVAPSVKSVLEQVGYSERTVREKFGAQVGLTPKGFHRVMRFQKLLAQIGNSSTVNWGELASDCGYYDQSHFIHDFREFSGMRPSEYLEKRGEWLNHVPER